MLRAYKLDDCILCLLRRSFWTANIPETTCITLCPELQCKHLEHRKRFPFFWAGSVFDHMDYYRHARNRRKWGFKRGYESNGIRAEMMKNHWKRPKKVFGSCLGPRGRWFETSHSDQKTRWNHKISAGFLCKLFDFCKTLFFASCGAGFALRIR